MTGSLVGRLVDLPQDNMCSLPTSFLPPTPRCTALLQLHARVIFGELTCPSEERIEVSNIIKKARYVPLAEEIRHFHKQRGDMVILPFEVGSRGFTARSTRTFLRKIGLSNTASTHSCNGLGSCSSMLSVHQLGLCSRALVS